MLSPEVISMQFLINLFTQTRKFDVAEQLLPSQWVFCNRVKLAPSVKLLFSVLYAFPDILGVIFFFFKFLFGPRSIFVEPLIAPVSDFVCSSSWVSNPEWISRLHSFLLACCDPEGHNILGVISVMVCYKLHSKNNILLVLKKYIFIICQEQFDFHTNTYHFVYNFRWKITKIPMKKC